MKQWFSKIECSKRCVQTFAFLLWFFGSYSQLSVAAEYVVDQKDKKFSTNHVKIKSGDVVKFGNLAPFFHNIFSLSETATFDLGSYPQGESRSVTFEKPGKVNIECAIHPSMQMIIEVE